MLNDNLISEPLINHKSSIMSRNLKTNSVSKATADQWIANWIDFATSKLKFPRKAVPRSILIPLIDIENIIKVFNAHNNKKLAGIRVYFTSKSATTDKPDAFSLSCIVVPTVKSKSGESGVQDDAIITIPPAPSRSKSAKTTADSASAETTEGTETIYDMTYPNPPYSGGYSEWV